MTTLPSTDRRGRALAQMTLEFTQGATCPDHENALATLARPMGVRAETRVPGAREVLSSLIDFWDAIPKYCMAPEQQRALRTEDGFLRTERRSFVHANLRCEMNLVPARLEDPDTGRDKEYFPTPADLVVERALIHLVARPGAGGLNRIDSELGFFVRFTMAELLSVLDELGAERNSIQLRHSLRVLAGARLRIRHEGGASHEEAILASLLEPAERGGVYVARLHTVIAAAVVNREYTQFCIGTWMKLGTDLTRWLFERMQMQRNLGLDGFGHRVTLAEALGARVIAATRVADQIKAMRRGVRRLVDQGVVDPCVLEPGLEGGTPAVGLVRRVREGRAVIDAEFLLPPTPWMVEHVVAANARRKINAVVPDRSLGLASA